MCALLTRCVRMGLSHVSLCHSTQPISRNTYHVLYKYSSLSVISRWEQVWNKNHYKTHRKKRDPVILVHLALSSFSLCGFFFFLVLLFSFVFFFFFFCGGLFFFLSSISLFLLSHGTHPSSLAHTPFLQNAVVFFSFLRRRKTNTEISTCSDFFSFQKKKKNSRQQRLIDFSLVSQFPTLNFENPSFFSVAGLVGGGAKMSSLSKELVFLILQFLDEENFKETVHR